MKHCLYYACVAAIVAVSPFGSQIATAQVGGGATRIAVCDVVEVFDHYDRDKDLTQ